jgi:hypothetical protein
MGYAPIRGYMVNLKVFAIVLSCESVYIESTLAACLNLPKVNMDPNLSCNVLGC